MASFPQPKDIDWPLLRKLIVEDGLSIRDAAIKFDVAPATICWHARKGQWNIGAARKARELSKPSPNGKPLRSGKGHFILARGTEAILAQFHGADISCRQAASVALQKAFRGFYKMTPVEVIDRAKDLRCLVEAANILFGWDGSKRGRNGLRGAVSPPNFLDLTPEQLAKLAAVEIQATPAPSLDSPSSQNAGTPEEPKRD
jgi:hypothetical protein